MKTINSAPEYITLKRQLTEYEDAAQTWMKENGNGIPQEVCKTFPHFDVVDNDLRSAIEVYEFMNFPPQKYFLYINEETSRATTWTGQDLGRVYLGSEYRDNFGGKRQSVTLYAINGMEYYGTYYKSSGNYARVKLAKFRIEKEYVVLGNYGQGYEVVTTELTRTEALNRLSEYRTNEPQTSFKLRINRVKISQISKPLPI